MNSNNNKNVGLDIKINNNKTNRISFRNNNDFFINPIKKKNPSIKDYLTFSNVFKGSIKKDIKFDILLSHKYIKHLYLKNNYN